LTCLSHAYPAKNTPAETIIGMKYDVSITVALFRGGAGGFSGGGGLGGGYGGAYATLEPLCVHVAPAAAAPNRDVNAVPSVPAAPRRVVAVVFSASTPDGSAALTVTLNVAAIASGAG
jgi:hypothetical protein